MSWGQELSAKRRVVLLGLIGILLLLSGCSSLIGNDFARPGAFNEINAVVDELALSEVGEVAFDARYGTTFPTDTTYYIALIEGSESLDAVQERLSSAGFEAGVSVGGSEGQEWSRGTGDDYARVFVGSLASGENVPVDPAGDEVVTVQNAGVLVKIASS